MVRMLTVSVISLSAAAMLSAQAPDKPQADPTTPPSTQAPAPSQPTAQSPAAPKAAAAANTTTITGCVKPGTSAGTYILASAAPSSASGAAGAASDVRGTSGSMSKDYNLTLKASDDFSKHVNHKVEVTGTVSPASASGASSSPAGGAAGAGASPSASSAKPSDTITVSSFKMVAATCP
jgi:hypothetical protein